MNTNYLNVLAGALKTAIQERNGENAKQVFAILKTFKAENESEASEIQKQFNSQFSKLELATAKQLTKCDSKNVATSETAKNELNILSLPIELQRKKVKNALSGYIASQGVFSLKYTKSEILAEYDSLDDNDFCALYSGATLQASKVYRAIISRLEKAAKSAK